jgi:predicted TIM-barrel fold metal-dependent hydrolase
MLVGGGLAWIPEYIWRLDWNFKMVRRVDAPWAKRMPSQYIAEHVAFTTYSMETSPTLEQFQTLLELIPNIDRTLLYASGYPYADGLDASDVAARLPKSIHDRVFHQNADAFYRFPEMAAFSAADVAGREEITKDRTS